WFHRDFLAATQGWTLAQTGAYFLLLGAQWEMGPLTTDMAELATIARTTTKDFKVIWRKVGRKFTTTADGLVNERLEVHRQKALQLRNQHRAGAERTNAQRSANRVAAVVVPLAERHAERIAVRDAERTLSVSPPSPSPSPSLKMLTKEKTEHLQSN